jgi:hypothetical protein
LPALRSIVLAIAAVLPKGSPAVKVLTRLESEINAAGGSAMVVELKPKGAEELRKVRGLFDRSADYRALLEKLAAPASPRALERLRRSFERLAATDFLPGAGKRQAAGACRPRAPRQSTR